MLVGRVLARLGLFLDAYGLPERERPSVIDALLPAHEWCYDVVRAAVAGGHPTFRQLWRGGGRLRAERTRRWIADHDAELRRAVAGG